MAELLEKDLETPTESQVTAKRTQQMMYAISHDLLGATRIIKSFAEILESHLGGQLDDEARGYIANIDQAADVLRAKLESLSGLSRVNSRCVAPTACDVGLALDDAVTSLSAGIAGSEAMLDLNVAGSVFADRDQLVDIFVELLGNSLKFCDGPVSISVSSDVLDDRCVVTVIDSGPGFEARDPDLAFDLFRRFHPSRVPGTGTGLTIVRAILDRHNSMATIASTPEGGTTVRFSLKTEESVARESLW